MTTDFRGSLGGTVLLVVLVGQTTEVRKTKASTQDAAAWTSAVNYDNWVELAQSRDAL